MTWAWYQSNADFFWILVFFIFSLFYVKVRQTVPFKLRIASLGRDTKAGNIWDSSPSVQIQLLSLASKRESDMVSVL